MCHYKTTWDCSSHLKVLHWFPPLGAGTSFGCFQHPNRKFSISLLLKLKLASTLSKLVSKFTTAHCKTKQPHHERGKTRWQRWTDTSQWSCSMPLCYSCGNCLRIESAPLSPKSQQKTLEKSWNLKQSCAKETTRSRHKDVTWCGEQ